MVYLENVIPLSKLIGLLFLFCLPLLSILFLKTKRNDLARPVMGTIFLVLALLFISRITIQFENMLTVVEPERVQRVQLNQQFLRSIG